MESLEEGSGEILRTIQPFNEFSRVGVRTVANQFDSAVLDGNTVFA